MKSLDGPFFEAETPTTAATGVGVECSECDEASGGDTNTPASAPAMAQRTWTIDANLLVVAFAAADRVTA